MLKLCVLGSTRGTDLGAILDAIASERLDAAVSVVVSNRKSAFILERARQAGIPTVFVS
ncbi:MAG: phosphoribosylglycinamide formyltransferase, partial [FCB group bacterium]|nr:phosphoribosylglycinamide formyltransferase [FCB group bacterium]